jgi:phosphomannomutase
MVSISGLRGLIGSSLTPEVASRFAAAFGSYLRQSTGSPHPHVVLGRDSRPSGHMIELAASAGLLAVGCRVTTLGIATTPTTAIATSHLQAHGGIVITASHNPIIWNGIKTLRSDGVAPPPDQAQLIIDRFHQNRLDHVPVDQLQPIRHEPSANRIHLDRILPHVDVAAIRSRGFRVVLDSVCGAGGPATCQLLHELGVHVIPLHTEPTGQFPHTPEPTAENLTTLVEAVRLHGADLGFAQDPDADRLAIVDDQARYIGEEYTLVLAALHVLSKTPSPVAVNLSTSRMIDDIAARFHVPVHRTPVGEANVAAAMQRTGSSVGGEGNGGIIFPPVTFVRDSLSGIALILELLARTGQKLSQIVASIPAYTIVKDKLPIAPGMAPRAIAQLQQTFAGQKIDLQDGIRIDIANAWLHLRPSNTEPILRIIAEAPDEPTARRLIAQARAAIGS